MRGEASVWSNIYTREGLGEFLQEARQEQGVTQKQMAEDLGFSSVTLSAIETGKNASASKIERYLHRLGFRIVVVPKSASVKVCE